MTVQELRRKILDSVKGGYQDWAEAVEDVDAIIAAAKEEERGKIRRWVEEDAPISDDGVPYSSLLSYLAPKEEK